MIQRILLAGCLCFLSSNIFAQDVTEAKPSADKSASTNKETKNILFLAGRPSHGYGSHEHYAGCMLLARSIEQGAKNVEVNVVKHYWPKSDEAFKDVDSIIMYCDGGGRHPVNKNLEQIDKLAKKGVGIVCIHYGVEVPKGKPGDKMLEWTGGYFETHWSVNPHWTADFKELPKHAITRGVQPFSINDEWYYNMRFPEDMKGVTPILTAIPPKSTLSRPDGAHSGNPHVRQMAGKPTHVAWAFERKDGGRGFGFTGGHFHWNWGDDNFRQVVVNAICWTAKVDIPKNGIQDNSVSMDDLKKNRDYKPKPNFDFQKIKKRLETGNKSSETAKAKK